MNRIELVDMIVAAADRPIPAVVKGMHGGFVYLNPNGTTSSPKFFKTREEAVTWITENRMEQAQEFRGRLMLIDDDRLEEQRAYWIKGGKK